MSSINEWVVSWWNFVDTTLNCGGGGGGGGGGGDGHDPPRCYSYDRVKQIPHATRSYP